MPRSFLVKKVKLDDFPNGADMENAYRHRTDLSLRLHDKGRSGCINRCLENKSLRQRRTMTGR